MRRKATSALLVVAFAIGVLALLAPAEAADPWCYIDKECTKRGPVYLERWCCPDPGGQKKYDYCYWTTCSPLP